MSGTREPRPDPNHPHGPEEHRPQPGAHGAPGAAFRPGEESVGGGAGGGAAPRAVPQGLPVEESVYDALKTRAAAGGRGRSRAAQHDPAAGPDDAGPEGSDDGGEIPEERR